MTVSQQEMQAGQFSLGRNQDIILAFSVMAILVLLIIPIPTFMVDLLLTVNILFPILWRTSTKLKRSRGSISREGRRGLW